MKLVINGVEIPNVETGVEAVMTLDGDETIRGLILMRVVGGCLTVVGPVEEAVRVEGDWRRIGEPFKLEVEGTPGLHLIQAGYEDADEMQVVG